MGKKTTMVPQTDFKAVKVDSRHITTVPTSVEQNRRPPTLELLASVEANSKH